MPRTFPPLKHFLPTAPDKIQKFSEQATGAPVKMSHLNRLGLYVGSEIDNIIHDASEGSGIPITKPCGYAKVINVPILNTGEITNINLVFDYQLWEEGVLSDTITFAQVTPASVNLINIQITDITSAGAVSLVVTALEDGVEEFGLMYTVIPQIS